MLRLTQPAAPDDASAVGESVSESAGVDVDVATATAVVGAAVAGDEGVAPAAHPVSRNVTVRPPRRRLAVRFAPITPPPGGLSAGPFPVAVGASRSTPERRLGGRDVSHPRRRGRLSRPSVTRRGRLVTGTSCPLR